MHREAVTLPMLAALIAVAGPAHAEAVEHLTLTLPRPPRSGEPVTLAVSVGPIGRSRIEVMTAQGEVLGTISAFGPAAAQAGGTFLLPVPSGAMQGGKLDLHFTLANGQERRSPTDKEIISVRLSLPPD